MTRRLSARFTLTAWYTSILVVMICALGAAMYFGVRHTVIRAADDNLTVRIEEIGPFIAGRLHSKHANELPHEFEAHLAGLEPGGELLQVADSQRRWIYQSASINGYGVTLPQPSGIRSPIFETLVIRGSHLRIVSSTLRVGDQIYSFNLVNRWIRASNYWADSGDLHCRFCRWRSFSRGPVVICCAAARWPRWTRLQMPHAQSAL